MLTYPSNYEKALQSPFEENWLFQLHSDDTGNNFIGLSFSDTTVDSVFYYGSVLNRPSIRESINLDRSIAKTTNLSITIPNFNYNGSDISTQLLNRSGSTHYLNYPVKIYSQLNSATALSDCLQVFNGRLRYVSLTGDKIQLQIVSERPWDNIDIPNVVSTNGVYKPVAYGDYTNNSAQSTENNKLYPAPLLIGSGFSQWFAVTDTIASGSGKGHYYDKNAKSFANLTLLGNGASSVYFGIPAVRIDGDITRTHRLKPQYDSGSWTNATNAIDNDNNTFADSGTQTANNSEATQNYVVKLPSLSGKVTAFKLYVKATLTYTGSSSSLDFVNFRYATTYDGTTGSFANILNVNNPSTSANQTLSTSGDADITNSGSDHTEVDLIAPINSNENQLPDSITLQSRASTTGTGDVIANVKLYDIWFEIVCQEDYTNEPTAAKQTVEALDKIYIGTDGLEKSWSSGTITKIHDAHRDIIHRFTGWGVDLGSNTKQENWSSGLNMDSVKTDFKIRYHVLDPQPLKKVLEKLQYEGGFIARFRADASLQYITVPSSPSASVTLGSSDISKLDVAHVPLDEIITKMHIQWNKNPAESIYADEVTLTNGGSNTLRTRLNFTKDKENVKEVKLDAYVDDSSAQRFFDYYDGIVGDLFIKISGEIVNPLYYKLEVGDQIAIDNSYPYAPFGESWSGKVFMVTSISRSTHSMKFSARQIN